MTDTTKTIEVINAATIFFAATTLPVNKFKMKGDFEMAVKGDIETFVWLDSKNAYIDLAFSQL